MTPLSRHLSCAIGNVSPQGSNLSAQCDQRLFNPIELLAVRIFRAEPKWGRLRPQVVLVDVQGFGDSLDGVVARLVAAVLDPRDCLDRHLGGVGEVFLTPALLLA